MNKQCATLATPMLGYAVGGLLLVVATLDGV